MSTNNDRRKVRLRSSHFITTVKYSVHERIIHTSNEYGVKKVYICKMLCGKGKIVFWQTQSSYYSVLTSLVKFRFLCPKLYSFMRRALPLYRIQKDLQPESNHEKTSEKSKYREFYKISNQYYSKEWRSWKTMKA